MNEELSTIPDLSDLTCTNLMIRLKIMLKKSSPGSAIEFIIRRDQRDTIEVPFSRTGYMVKIHKIDNNRYLANMEKKEEGQVQ
jgi:hypothetical protein